MRIIRFVKPRLIAFFDFIRYKKSYSQAGEDTVLSSFFEHQKKYKGFYVDVGAHHPIRFSNTNHFYRKGWRGINIDSTPGSMRAFNWLRKRDINLEIGIGSASGALKFYCFNEPALNTFDENLAKERSTGTYFVKRTVDIQVEPLCKILEKYLPANQKIDFLTIDVEGLDLVVLQSNDWARYRPSYILVEDTNFILEKSEESSIYNFLSQLGYKIVAILKRTIIYERSDQK
jgi:FkbM family methyltransferase